MELCQGKFRMDIRRKFQFGHWNRLPRDVQRTPSLAEFTCLDKALRHGLWSGGEKYLWFVLSVVRSNLYQLVR